MATTESMSAASTLATLIEICEDGREGFETAAGALEEPTIKRELMDFSRQRAEFVRQLQGGVAELGETPPTSGSISGTLHRGWINLRSIVSTRDNHAVLTECERGEDVAVAAYQAAMKTDLPSEFSGIVGSQFAAVRQTHDRVKFLRDSHKKS